jgi:hypothetical protein
MAASLTGALAGNDEGHPTPQDIISIAVSLGYVQRRPMVSSTIFLIEQTPQHGMPACRINIFYTTRSIMTHLNHPDAGLNELWRSNAYNDLEELKVFLENPRIHTGKGYRNAEKAVRGCVGCGEMKERTEFSKNQWIKGPDENKCKECIGDISHLTKGMDNLVVTQNLLDVHNRSIGGAAVQNGLERREFNCPDCPNHGRGDFIFFKRVPIMKPVVKCPQCKKASRGRCKRLYAVPKQAEKGYGLFKCLQCGDKWGSSRAVADIGQNCYACVEKGVESEVKPFRLEVWKRTRNAGRRRPKEPIGEDEPDSREYGEDDGQRNEFAGGNALVGGGFEKSYEFADEEPRSGGPDDVSSSISLSKGASRIPKGYKHKCAGCASGACKNRRVPMSEVHESDGNSVSTSASIVTNSSVDKSDFFDRDEDFSGFDMRDTREV